MHKLWAGLVIHIDFSYTFSAIADSVAERFVQISDVIFFAHITNRIFAVLSIKQKKNDIQFFVRPNVNRFSVCALSSSSVSVDKRANVSVPYLRWKKCSVYIVDVTFQASLTNTYTGRLCVVVVVINTRMRYVFFFFGLPLNISK